MPELLTPHFTLEELIHSQTAERMGLDNTPPDPAIDHLRVLCEQILEPGRLVLGPLHIDSGYRSPQVNRLVGGSSTSAHLSGWAADVIPLHSDISKRYFARWVLNNVEFDQIILEYGERSMQGEPAWVHVSADPRNRREVLRIYSGSNGYHPIQL